MTVASPGARFKRVDQFLPQRSLAFGAIEVDDPVFYVVDLGVLPDVEGFDSDRLVGHEVFHRFAVTIDDPARRLTPAEPDAFVAPANDGDPVRARRHIPLIKGAIDGVPFRFSVDTGSRASVTTHSPFTREQQLVEKYTPKFETSAAGASAAR